MHRLLCHNIRLALFFLALMIATALLLNRTTALGSWRTLSGGLELGTFDAHPNRMRSRGKITILRIDPTVWGLSLLAASRLGYKKGLSARQWCGEQNLVAAINAGMFAKDYRTHVGYMKVDDHINNRNINRYQSVAAFAPYKAGPPPFRIYDLDSNPCAIPTLQKAYRFVIQNLRLIKRPAENRWEPQSKMWNEAALGEDDQGRALFIFSQASYAMYDLNNLLLELPINLVCAQHLEGGPDAQLFIRHNSVVLEYRGGYEARQDDIPDSSSAGPIPNIIGVCAK